MALVCICTSYPSPVARSGNAITAALLQSTSSRSNFARIASAAALTLAKLCKSQGIASNLPPGTAALSSASDALERGLSRLSKSTVAPSFASSRAQTKPVPLVVPVMATTRPVMSRVCFSMTVFRCLVSMGSMSVLRR